MELIGVLVMVVVGGLLLAGVAASVRRETALESRHRVSRRAIQRIRTMNNELYRRVGQPGDNKCV